ncbi:MFS transporter [Streptomyces sp. OK228]|uniref:MFS transporter n=1 Tax=Streptomyces sp. OK228 TaxID=1882786 RepID=UPI001C53A6AB
MGLYGATASVGFVAGQVLGGVLVEFLTWRSVFLVNVPVGLAALLLAPVPCGSRDRRVRGGIWTLRVRCSSPWRWAPWSSPSPAAAAPASARPTCWSRSHCRPWPRQPS